MDKKEAIKEIKYKIRSIILKTLLYLILFGLAFIFLHPFIYLIVTSFKSYNDINNTIIKWIPREFSPQNWSLAWEALNANKTIINSILVTFIATIGHLLSASMAGYGLARFKFKGQKALLGLLLLSIIVPIQTIIVPIYMMYSKIGWVGTHLPMIIPAFLGMGLKGGLYIFIFRQFYLKIPPSLEEAAALDGCGAYKTFFRIIIPSSKSPMLVCFILSIVWHWNDFFEPGIYITSSSDYLLPQMLPTLYSLFQNISQASSAEAVQLALAYHEGVVMAATLICVIPLLIIYFIFQRQFMQGIERTGMVE